MALLALDESEDDLSSTETLSNDGRHGAALDVQPRRATRNSPLPLMLQHTNVLAPCRQMFSPPAACSHEFCPRRLPLASDSRLRPCHARNRRVELPIEKLPQEHYLRLIAAGMKQYGLDEDYIQDQILGVPFVPSRKPDNYLQFPVLEIPNQRQQHQQHPPCSSAPPHILPKITLEHYQRICRDDPSHLLFIVGHHVILIGNHDPNHPGPTWFARNGFGKGDVTFVLHTRRLSIPTFPTARPPRISRRTRRRGRKITWWNSSSNAALAPTESCKL